jgi:nucleotide-binding universal stress UspA family protein
METLLVLTDFSKTASNAAMYAAALTHQLNVSRIILFNSYEFRPVATDIPITTQVGLAASKTDSINRLQALRNEILPFVNATTTVDYATSENPLLYAIHALHEQYHAEITIMGITGMSGFERALIGSNTINVAREITSPLLLIPNGAAFQPINKIVFATDLKTDLQKPAMALRNIIDALNAKLLILNIENKKDEHFHAELKRERTGLMEAWGDHENEYYFNENQDISKGIIEFINTHDVQIVIAIPKKHGFWEGIFHRSVTKRLTYHTPIPLLLLHENED